MNKKTAKKWQKVTKEKVVKPQSNTTAFLIKTHERRVSQAQILVPAKYKQLSKPDSILIIQPANKQFVIYVQATPDSLRTNQMTEQQSEKCQISILKNIADLYGAIYADNGMFRGQIRVVNEKQILPNRELQYVQIVIRKNYFSRRDQYKISELLKEKVTHVFNRKILYFENMNVEVTNMMKSNQEIVKSGFITKNTKLIFRSACAKTAFLVELSKQTFDLNPTRELYLQRMIQFLIIYFNRNRFFLTKHRVQIILYARLFYPQFKTLTEAYKQLMKQATLGSENKFQVNYAVSLQKDYKGRVYQDAYRKVIWQSEQVSNFKKFFLEKVSEFMFTLNWDINKSKHSEFISKSINSKVANQFECVEIQQKWRIKPFIHRMKCQLAASYDSNLFEAICLVSEQYKHHYKFRALDQTGNAIIILSAGRSQYQTDKTTYRMAKSYIYLTNISCMMVNLNIKVDKIKVHVYDTPKQMFKEQNDVKKLDRLVHWCIEQFVYQSPINERIRFTSHKAGFQMKSFIYPQDILVINQKDPMFKEFSRDKCHCSTRHPAIKQHYYLNQQKQIQSYQQKLKQIDWINSYFMNNQGLKIHQKFYEKTNFITDFYQPFGTKMINQPCKQNSDYSNLSYSFINQLGIFQDDLQKIIIKKQRWFDIGLNRNQLNLKLDKYIRQSVSIRKTANQQQSKNQLLQALQKTNKKMFSIQTQKQLSTLDFQLSSNEDIIDKAKNRMQDFYDSKPTFRKDSQYINDIPYSPSPQIIQQQQPTKTKINIFQQTLRNKQYNIADMNKQKSKKYLSHNKQRLRSNCKQSNIHYLMTYYAEPNLRKLNKFIRRQFYESLSQQQIKINQYFQYEKQWKNICFPILTPIYTKYKQDFKEIQIILDSTETGDDKTLQNDACRLLMENYQLSEVKANKTIYKFSKGNIIKTLQKNDDNITKTYTIDKDKQSSLIPFLLYRYLLYEEKDYRFCSKTIYFQDKNFYDKENKDSMQHETKSLKLLFLFDSSEDCRDSIVSYNPIISTNNLNSAGMSKKSPIQQFKRLFKQKFPPNQLFVTQKRQQPVHSSLFISAQLQNTASNAKQFGLASSRSLLRSLNLKSVNPKKSFLVANEKQRQYQTAEMLQQKKAKVKQIYFQLGKLANKKYNSEEIKLIYDSQFSQKNLFKIVIEWDHCSSILVSEFVENLITIGRRSKFNSFKTTTQDVFNIKWNMNVVGQIVLSNKSAVQMLQQSVHRNDEWYYDTMGFFMDSKGIAFIKFQKQKKLVLWKDNNYQKKNRHPDLYNQQYNKFFMLSAAFDFLGEMMEEAYHIYLGKRSNYQMQERNSIDESSNCSMKGSYNNSDQHSKSTASLHMDKMKI